MSDFCKEYSDLATVTILKSINMCANSKYERNVWNHSLRLLLSFFLFVVCGSTYAMVLFFC